MQKTVARVMDDIKYWVISPFYRSPTTTIFYLVYSAHYRHKKNMCEEGASSSSDDEGLDERTMVS